MLEDREPLDVTGAVFRLEQKVAVVTGGRRVSGARSPLLLERLALRSRYLICKPNERQKLRGPATRGAGGSYATCPAPAL